MFEAQTGVQMKELLESFLLGWQNKRQWGFLYSQQQTSPLVLFIDRIAIFHGPK